MYQILPFPFFDLLMIFCSIFLLIWVLFAIYRFIGALQVRASIISGKIVYIRGLGGALSSFVELSSYGHFNSMLNVRQSQPPSKLQSLSLPFVLKTDQIILSEKSSSSILHFSSTISETCDVFLLVDTNTEQLRSFLKRHTDQASMLQFVQGFSNRTGGQELEKLVISESCAGVNYVQHVGVGEHDLNVSLRGFVANKKTIGIVFVRNRNFHDESEFTTNAMVTASSNPHRNLTNGPDEYRSLPTGDHPYLDQFGHNNSTNQLGFLMGIALITAGNFIVTPEQDKRYQFSLVDTIIIASNSKMYSCQEVFGWKKIDAPPRTTEEYTCSTSQENGIRRVGVSVTPVASSSVFSSQPPESESNGFDTDCVVCLTEKKDVVLLPCRHYCVCHSCLLHIDKCPVCRSLYNEFILEKPASN